MNFLDVEWGQLSGMMMQIFNFYFNLLKVELNLYCMLVDFWH